MNHAFYQPAELPASRPAKRKDTRGSRGHTGGGQPERKASSTAKRGASHDAQPSVSRGAELADLMMVLAARLRGLRTHLAHRGVTFTARTWPTFVRALCNDATALESRAELDRWIAARYGPTAGIAPLR